LDLDIPKLLGSPIGLPETDGLSDSVLDRAMDAGCGSLNSSGGFPRGREVGKMDSCRFCGQLD
jgi:hypothetical protein